MNSDFMGLIFVMQLGNTFLILGANYKKDLQKQKMPSIFQPILTVKFVQYIDTKNYTSFEFGWDLYKLMQV